MNIEGPINQNVVNVYDQLPIGGQFQGQNNDCTEDAYMGAVKACDPRRPATGAELDRLVAEAVNAGQAAQGGAMTAANLSWLCQREGTPYQQHGGAGWDQVLGWLGGQGGYGTWPVVVQVSNGSALPGNQPGVQGHAVTILAWDGGKQLLTIYNGDSANGRTGQLDVIAFADMMAANPFCATEIRLARPVPTPPAPPIDRAGIIADAEDIIKKAGG